MKSRYRRLVRTIHTTGIAAALAIACAHVQAQAVLDQTSTVALPSASVPLEQDFNAVSGTTYIVTVTDIGAQLAASAQASGTPAVFSPLQTLKLAISANDALVSLMPVVSDGTTPVTDTQLVEADASPAGGEVISGAGGVATATFTAAATGSYRLHVVGTPASGSPPGPVGVQVKAADGTVAGTLGGSIGPAAQALPADTAIVQDTFTVSAAGSYTITLNDLAVPLALQSGGSSLIVLPVGGSAPSALLSAPGSSTAMLAAGTYTLIAYGVAANDPAGNIGGGLFSASVVSGVTVAYSKAVPVGTTVPLGSADQPLQLAAGSYSLSLKDLQFPASLSQLRAAAVPANPANAVVVLSAAGTQSLSVAASDTYQVFAAATVATGGGGGASLGAGSYAVQLTAPSSGQSLLSVAEAVTVPGGTLTAYAYNTSLPAAGSYIATLTDFQLPSALGTAEVALVQNGSLVGAALTKPGSTSATPLAGGALTALAFASASTPAGGLMDIAVSDSSNTLVFDQPQGVGAAFQTTPLTISSKGAYQFTLSDLDWPASFSQGSGQLTGIVTHGPTVVGEFFGGGTLTSSLTASTYYVSVVATPSPSGQDGAGTYALNVSQAPPAPTVSLSASPTSVVSGGTVTLSWTTTNATSCTGSGGGWTGAYSATQAASGSATSPAITASTTFTLTCTGTGGQGSGTVTVGLSSGNGADGSKKGGGGALSPEMLLALAGCLVFARLNNRGGRA